MTELFIHIGLPKTGTTAIQNYLASNREKLHNQGILYPPIYKPDKASTHHGIPWLIYGNIDSNFDFYQRDFNEYIKEESQNFEKIIISSEFFWSAFFQQPEKTVNFFEKLSSSYNVNIITTISEFSDQVNSTYTQHIKTLYSAALSLEQHIQVLIEQVTKNFLTLVSMSKFIAPENFRVIDTTQKELTIEKFLAIVDIDSSSLQNTSAVENEKLSLEILRVLWNLTNKYPQLKDLTPSQKALLLNSVSESIQDNSTISYSLVSPEKNFEINNQVVPLFEKINSVTRDDLSLLITKMKTKPVYSEAETNQITKNLNYIYTPLNQKEICQMQSLLINVLINQT